MCYRVWYSTESLADYIIEKTCLKDKGSVVKARMYESDASKPACFHTLPDHIKKILYLDAPDIIVEWNFEPIFTIEVSTEAGTGHNVFQRFARIAASVENNVPTLYVYPEAVYVSRQQGANRWDRINPLIFNALNDVMRIYQIPALLYFFPSLYRSSKGNFIEKKGLCFDSALRYAGCPNSEDPEMSLMFAAINEIVRIVEEYGVKVGRERLLANKIVSSRCEIMGRLSACGDNLSPLSATEIVPTTYLLKYLSSYEKNGYFIGELLRSRKETLVYKVNAGFRGDPYPGALAAIDYLRCRTGKTFEDRELNLVLCWGNLTIDRENETFSISGEKASVGDFVDQVRRSESKNLLLKGYSDLSPKDIPRYYMQVRYGSMFSKVKHIRVFSYFADAILFQDGALWRDA